MFHSVVLTIHNKGWLLPRVLDGILKNTGGSYELIVVLDGCTDDSKQVLTQFLEKVSIPRIIIETPDVFETLANNAGLGKASGDYCILVQDDMVIREKDWNLHLVRPAQVYQDVFAVSANAAHNWRYNKDNKQEKSPIVPNQWTDILNWSELVRGSTLQQGEFVIRDSVNRGPLLLRTSSLKKLNYLDPSFAPLDMDDHDLCYRAYSQLKQVSGCYKVDYLSDPKWGSTRVGGKISKIHAESQQKNAKIVWQRHRQLILGPKHDETRRL